MAFVLEDFIRETTASEGTDDLVLAGAVSQFNPFSSALSDGDTTIYGILASDGSKEVGLGTYVSASNTLQRTTVRSSTDGDAKLDLPTGTHIVFIGPDADGMAMAYASGESLPSVVPGGRLTLSSGDPVPSSDLTNQSTLYYTPYKHGLIPLYDGSKWVLHSFTECSLALSGLTSGKPYDVFLYDNSGTLTLSLTAWTNDTTRATALVLQDGVKVKTGATGYRYLGSIYTTGTTTTSDSEGFRLVYNEYNKEQRGIEWASGNDSHTYTPGTDTSRQWNNNSNARVSVMCGSVVSCTGLYAYITNSVQSGDGANLCQGLVSLNATTSTTSQLGTCTRVPVNTTCPQITTTSSLTLPERHNNLNMCERVVTAGATLTANYGGFRGTVIL